MRHKNHTLPFEGGALAVAEDRRFRESYEGIVQHAERMPAMVVSTRHHGAKYHASTIYLVKETCAKVTKADQRRATILAGLAHNREERLALLAMLTSEPGVSPALTLEAQLRDLSEDLSEKRYDADPSPANAAQWLSDLNLAVSAEEAVCLALRPKALLAYAPRERPAA